MKIIKGNIFESDNYDCLCIPTNGQTKQNGTLGVWGAGIALEAAKRWRSLPEKHAKILKTIGHEFYYLDDVEHKGKYIGIYTFPTKNHWKDPSPIELIEKSARELAEYNLKYLPEERFTFALPLPGGGNGRLNHDFVIKRLELILTEDNYHIYYL